MDEVHSSSFKNIVQGEAVGVRPRWKEGHLWRVGWASCFSCLHSVTPGTDQPAALYQLTSKDGDSGGINDT